MPGVLRPISGSLSGIFRMSAMRVVPSKSVSTGNGPSHHAQLAADVAICVFGGDAIAPERSTVAVVGPCPGDTVLVNAYRSMVYRWANQKRGQRPALQSGKANCGVLAASPIEQRRMGYSIS